MHETHQGKIDLLLTGTREERVYACASSFKPFCVFFFTEYFSYPFHEEFWADFEDLVYGRVKGRGVADLPRERQNLLRQDGA